MTLIFKSKFVGNPNAPFLPLDQSINKGTFILVDALNTASWSSQATPVTGNTLKNLTQVAPNGTWDVQTGHVTFNNGFFNVQPGIVCTVDFGTGWMPATNDALIIAWYKAPTTLQAGREFFTKSSTLNTGAFNIYLGADFIPRVLIAGSGNNNTQVVNEMICPANQVVQLAIATNFAQNKALLYKNGALVKTITCQGAWPVLTDTLKIGQIGGTWYRAQIDNLTLADLDPTVLVAADYARNSTRFV